jgi:hypothetical protein
MSKKTRSVHKRDKPNKKHKNTRRKIYRKSRRSLTFPGSKSILLFTVPEQKETQKIMINQDSKQSGNMIPGLRNM